ncbi:MAG: hypothetical protein R2789_11120 [Microthrixaceae bacterium]
MAWLSSPPIAVLSSSAKVIARLVGSTSMARPGSTSSTGNSRHRRTVVVPRIEVAVRCRGHDSEVSVVEVTDGWGAVEARLSRLSRSVDCWSLKAGLLDMRAIVLPVASITRTCPSRSATTTSVPPSLSRSPMAGAPTSTAERRSIPSAEAVADHDGHHRAGSPSLGQPANSNPRDARRVPGRHPRRPRSRRCRHRPGQRRRASRYRAPPVRIRHPIGVVVDHHVAVLRSDPALGVGHDHADAHREAVGIRQSSAPVGVPDPPPGSSAATVARSIVASVPPPVR